MYAILSHFSTPATPVERTPSQIHDREDADIVLSDRVQNTIREPVHGLPAHTSTHFRGGFRKLEDLLYSACCFVKESGSQARTHMLVLLRNVV